MIAASELPGLKMPVHTRTLLSLLVLFGCTQALTYSNNTSNDIPSAYSSSALSQTSIISTASTSGVNTASSLSTSLAPSYRSAPPLVSQSSIEPFSSSSPANNNATAYVSTSFSYSAAQSSGAVLTGTATVTNSENATSTGNATSLTTEAPTCCYLWPVNVGINTWYTSSLDVTVEKIITTWHQYNNSLIPAGSTTITYANATNFYGTYGAGNAIYTTQPLGSATSTETYTEGITSSEVNTLLPMM